MGLRLYNTLTRQKEDFAPLDPARVRMYVCGPTVYDRAHIGNARPVIVFDVLFRLLRHLAKQGVWDGGKGETEVTYVRNITDVDDKINARAAERGISIGELTKTTYQWFQEDVAALGCLPPTAEPRATEYIAQMIKMIEALIATRHAYVAEGHVLFDVSSKPDYGKLSNRSLDEMIAGARVEVAPYKKNPMDFVLWKPSSSELPGWDSPWGRGRPGWHIECSAMGEALLGTTFDIHGGGIDLVFPHHENEIAQSECAHRGAPLAKVWMHNGFLQVEGEKMAKSAGNFVTIRELLADWPGEVIRLAMLQTHYREPINWTAERLREVRSELSIWAEIARQNVSSEFNQQMQIGVQKIKPERSVVEALCNDLNSPMALTRLRSLYRQAAEGDAASAESFMMTMIWLGVYRYHFHSAYEAHHFSATNVKPLFIKKFENDILRARTTVLNEYNRSSDFAVRKRSLQAVNAKANAANPHMAAEGIQIVINEHCNVELEPLVESAKRDEGLINSLISARTEARKRKDFKEADEIRDRLAKMGIELEDMQDGTMREKNR
jgi:cysteinyl-tRNA synthetase